MASALSDGGFKIGVPVYAYDGGELSKLTLKSVNYNTGISDVIYEKSLDGGKNWKTDENESLKTKLGLDQDLSSLLKKTPEERKTWYDKQVKDIKDNFTTKDVSSRIEDLKPDTPKEKPEWKSNKYIDTPSLSLDRMKELGLKENKKKPLKESMIGGIVGIGAINQIPPREKTDYELAFEHFLGERYETKFENREQNPYTMEEEKMPAVDSSIKNDANFQKLVDYFKKNEKKAKKVEDELMSLKEAYKKDGKYYDEDAYGDEKEITFKKYLIAKLVNIGLPAAALGFVAALMAGPLGAMAPGEILQAIGIAAGIGGAAGAALDYGETKPIGEIEKTSLYENVDEEVKQKIMQMVDNAKFENSQKGNDLRFAVTKALLTSDGQKIFKTQMRQKLKNENNDFDYYGTDKEALNAFFNDGMDKNKKIDDQTYRDQMAAIQGGYY